MMRLLLMLLILVPSSAWRLKVETFNASQWGPAKAWCADMCEADVVLVQEHRLTSAEEVEVASAWARSKGWKSLWTRAQRTGAGKQNTSAGTAILVRDEMGLRPLPEAGRVVEAKHRVTWGILEAPGFGEVLLGSIYLVTGEQLSPANLSIMAHIGLTIQTTGLQHIVGGDWNMERQVVQESSWGTDNDVRTRLLGHEGVGGTCKYKKQGKRKHGYSNIDFFAVDDRLALAVKGCWPSPGGTYNPHRPITMEFHPKAGTLVGLSWEKPEDLPKDLVQGPQLPRYREWARALQRCRAAEAGAHTDQRQSLIDQAYEEWSNAAEEELELFTGACLEKKGTRGKPPAMVVRPIIVQRSRPLPAVAGARPVLWVMDRMHEAQALGDKPLQWQARQWKAQLKGLPKWVKDDSTARGFLEEVKQWFETVADHRADLSHRVEAAAEAAQATAKQQAQEHWRQWAEAAVMRGAGPAHKVAKRSTPWAPTAVMDAEGQVVSSPSELLADQARKWHKLWRANTQGRTLRPGREACAELGFEDCKPGPLATPAQLRAISRSFPQKTAAGMDGWHVSHIALLSDSGLRALALVLQAAEAGSVWPTALAAILLPLLEKPTGGYRTIGVFPAVVRVWGKLRADMMAEWEDRHDLPSFSAGKGRAAEDVPWRIGVLAEEAVQSGQEAAAFTVGLEKFYETIQADILMDRCRRTGVPMFIVQLALVVYRSTRFVALGSFVARGEVAGRGIVAGCAHATRFIKAVYWQLTVDVSKMYTEIPTSLAIYIDDFTVFARGTRVQVRQALSAVGRELNYRLQHEIKCSIAQGKGGIAASSERLAAGLRKDLACFGHAKEQAYTCLGVDVCAGKERGSWWRQSRAAQRRSKTLRHIQRFRMFPRALGKPGMKVFTCGARPAWYHAVATTGLDGKQLEELRNWTARCSCRSLRGRNKEVSLAILHDSSWNLAMAATLRWAREAWQAGQRRGFGFSVVDMRRAFAASSLPQAWRRVRGPVGAMLLELRRLGWEAKSAFVIGTIDDEINLLVDSPAMLAHRIMKHYEWKQLQKAGESVGLPGPPAIEPIRRSAGRGGLEGMVTTSFVTGGTWTRKRLRDIGYLVQADCECGQEDTVYHRLYTCLRPEVIEARAAVADKAFLHRARVTGPTSMLYARALATHPADTEAIPKAEADPVVRLQQWSETGWQEKLHWKGPWFGRQHLYSDGSQEPSVWRDQPRAGWGLVQRVDGKPWRRAFGPVPRRMPQTAPASEWCGWLWAHVLSPTPQEEADEDEDCDITIFSDCQGVVDQSHKKGYEAMNQKFIYAGCLRQAVQARLGQRWALTHKVKAHTLDKGLVTEETATESDFGNKDADDAAAEGRRCHCVLPDQVLHNREWLAEEIKHVLALALAVLPLWQVEEQLVREPGLLAPKRQKAVADAGAEHVWAWCASHWQCLRCQAMCFGKRKRTRCPGRSKHICRVLEQPMGHSLRAGELESGALVLWCSLCGAWGARTTTRDLSQRCRREPSRKHKENLARVNRGLHPWHGSDEKLVGSFGLKGCVGEVIN